MYAFCMHNILLNNKLGALWSVLDASMARMLGTDSPSTAATVLTLHFHAPLTGTDLSRILGLSQPATVRLIDKLADAGMVARNGKSEGKAVDIALTAAGQTRAEAMLTARSAAMADLLRPLTDAKRQALTGLLDEILHDAVETGSQARFLCRFCDHGVCDGPVCPIGCRAREIALERKERPT